MSVSSIAAAREIPEARGQGWQAATTWVWRFLVTLLVMAVWLVVVLAVIAYLLPTAVDPTTYKPRNGVFCSFPINIYLGLLTAAYYVSILPTLLLPIRDEERFLWFLHIAFGWMVSLLGSIALLALFGQVLVHPIDMPLNWRRLSAVLAAVFLVPMALSLACPVDGRRRVTCLVSLLVGWVIFQSGVFGFVQYLQSLQLEAETIQSGMSVPKLAFLFFAVLYAVLVTALTLPESSRLRRELLAFLTLLWCFALAGVICFHVMRGRIELANALTAATPGPFRRWLLFHFDPSGGVPTTALMQFGCLVLTVWLAPFLSWLGMPWAHRARGQWAFCLLLAAVVVLRFVQQTPFSERDPLLVHVLTNYDGPHLAPIDFARY